MTSNSDKEINTKVLVAQTLGNILTTQLIVSHELIFHHPSFFWNTKFV